MAALHNLPLWQPAIALSILSALLCSVTLYIAGHTLSNGFLHIRKTPDGVELRSTGYPHDASLAIRPHREVLGRDAGREIRRLLLEAPIPLQVHVWNRVPAATADPELLVWMGPSMEEYPAALDIPLLWVHPDGPVPERFPPGSRLLLPQFDLTGRGSAWRRAAAQADLDVRTTPGVGQEITPAWPEALFPELSTLKERTKP